MTIIEQLTAELEAIKARRNSRAQQQLRFITANYASAASKPEQEHDQRSQRHNFVRGAGGKIWLEPKFLIRRNKNPFMEGHSRKATRTIAIKYVPSSSRRPTDGLRHGSTCNWQAHIKFAK